VFASALLCCIVTNKLTTKKVQEIENISAPYELIAAGKCHSTPTDQVVKLQRSICAAKKTTRKQKKRTIITAYLSRLQSLLESKFVTLACSSLVELKLYHWSGVRQGVVGDEIL